MNDSKLKAMAFGLFAVALWAAIPAFVKVGSTESTLPFLLVLRFAISSLIFITLGRQLWQKRRLVPARWFFTMSACLGANFYFQGLAMLKLPVSWYLIIFSLNPLFALILMGIKLQRRTVFGVALAIFGTFLFVDLSEVQSNYGALAIAYVVIGMVTWVIYTLIVRNFHATHSNTEVTALTQYAALFAGLVIWIANGLPVFELNSATGVSVLALGALTPLAYFGFNYCLRALPRFGVASQYLEPVFGVAIGFAFFHESLSISQFVGSVLIVIGSATTES